MMSEKAVLFCGDQRIELPILVGTEGERALDISRLRDAVGIDDLRFVFVEYGRLQEFRHVH